MSTLTNKEKKEIMSGLDLTEKYICTYGVRRETYHINKDSLHGLDSSGNYKWFYPEQEDCYGDDEVIDFNELHDVYALTSLFTKEK